MCRDLAHKVEAVKPDRAETDRFRAKELPWQRKVRGRQMLVIDFCRGGLVPTLFGKGCWVTIWKPDGGVTKASSAAAWWQKQLSNSPG